MALHVPLMYSVTFSTFITDQNLPLIQEMNIAVQIRTMGAILFPVAVVLRFHGCIPASVA